MNWIAFTINFVALVTGIVTIIWFFKDMRRENGKLLKEIAQILEGSQKILENTQKILLDHTKLFNEMIQLVKK